MRALDQPRDRLDRADLVVHLHDRDQANLARQIGFGIDQSVRTDRQLAIPANGAGRIAYGGVLDGGNGNRAVD